MIQKGKTNIGNKKEACAGSACFTYKRRERRGGERERERREDGRTEIISPVNEQYKIALRAAQVLRRALRAVPER